MRQHDVNLGHGTNATSAEEFELTNSFPYMIIVTSFAVITIMHLLINPMAKQFANQFLGR